MTDLDYVSGSTVIPEGAFGISPSSLGKFFNEPHNWYRDTFLDEKSLVAKLKSLKKIKTTYRRTHTYWVWCVLYY